MSSKKKSRAGEQIATYFVLAGMAVLFLAACEHQTVLSTPTPTVTLIQRSPSQTSTPYPTTTPRPTATFSPTPTLNSLASLSVEFNIPEICLFNYLVSRDENWIAADCNLERELIIIEKLSGTRIAIPYQEIYNGDSSLAMSRPLMWSSDNRFLYFTTVYRDGEYDFTFDDTGSLYQFDTENRTWSILVHAIYRPYYFFSEDGERYVYFNHNNYYTELEVGMVEILTKKSKRVVLKGYMISDLEYEWSRNMNTFAIVLWELQFRNGTPGNVLLKIDFKKMDMEIIEEFDRNNLLGE